MPASPLVPWLPLTLSSAAGISGVLAESAPQLHAAAVVPIFTRAFKALFQQGTLDVNSLHAAAMTVPVVGAGLTLTLIGHVNRVPPR